MISLWLDFSYKVLRLSATLWIGRNIAHARPVYDHLSRSELQNGQPFPSVSTFTKPGVSAERSIDIVFDAKEPKEKSKLDQDGARKRPVPEVPFLWADVIVFRQDLEAGTHRRLQMTRMYPGCGRLNIPGEL